MTEKKDTLLNTCWTLALNAGRAGPACNGCLLFDLCEKPSPDSGSLAFVAAWLHARNSGMAASV